MSKEERDEPMNTAIKKFAKDGITGLTKEKKELLKKFIGSSPSKIDMNKVRDWWKSEKYWFQW